MPALLRPPPAHAALVATHFAVILPQNVAADSTVNVIVEAEDAHNKIVTNFKGTVAIRLGTADAGAVIPAAFTFSASDHGIHTFQATLEATGAQKVMASSGRLAGTASFNVNEAVTHFSVTALGTPTVGASALVNVTALDANDNPVPGYTGTIHFTTSGFVSYPLADYTFTGGDRGSHLFSVTFADSGSQTLAVNDVASGSIVGGAQINVASDWYSSYSGYSGYPSYGYGYGGYGYGYGGYGYGMNYYGNTGYYGINTFYAPTGLSYYY